MLGDNDAQSPLARDMLLKTPQVFILFVKIQSTYIDGFNPGRGVLSDQITNNY